VVTGKNPEWSRGHFWTPLNRNGHAGRMATNANDSTSRRELGQALRAERAARNVSLRGMAGLIKASHGELSEIETGKRRAPAWVIDSYEKVLNLPPGHFPRAPTDGLDLEAQAAKRTVRRNDRWFREEVEWTIEVNVEGHGEFVYIRRRILALEETALVPIFTIWPEIHVIEVIGCEGGDVYHSAEQDLDLADLFMIPTQPIEKNEVHECGLGLHFADTGLRGWQTVPLDVAELSRLRYRIFFPNAQDWVAYRVNGSRGTWRIPTRLPKIPINSAGYCETTFSRFQEQRAYGIAWRHV
jgi:transcriptional regulator with XRE-family HTH domain